MSANSSLRPPVCHALRATPDTCFWGFFDSSRPPVLEVRSGDLVRVETLTIRRETRPIS
jgi:acetamidase/formamidase